MPENSFQLIAKRNNHQNVLNYLKLFEKSGYGATGKSV